MTECKCKCNEGKVIMVPIHTPRQKKESTEIKREKEREKEIEGGRERDRERGREGERGGSHGSACTDTRAIFRMSHSLYSPLYSQPAIGILSCTLYSILAMPI